jgi:hypothetical protein
MDEVEWRSEAMGDGFSEAWKAGWVECAGSVAMSKLEIWSLKRTKASILQKLPSTDIDYDLLLEY